MRQSSRPSRQRDQQRFESLWKQHVADIERWRCSLRPHLLRLLTKRSATLVWSRTLLAVVLDELQLDDLFRELVGDPRRLPARRYPQAIAVAIALRHSWHPDDLARLTKRLGIALSATDVAAHVNVARSTRDRGTRTPGHHRGNCGSRLRPVKALRSAPTPVGAGGLDRNVGRARQRLLRDDPADHPRTRRSPS